MEKEMNFETVEEARKKVKKEYPYLVSVIDVEREIRKSDIWDVLHDLENHIISRPRAEILLREYYCDVVQGTPAAEEKYGDAEELEFYKKAFDVACNALATFDTCPDNVFCPHIDTDIKCKDCWKNFITSYVKEGKTYGVPCREEN